MSETTPSLFSEAFRGELEEIVQRAVEKALNGTGHHEGDKLLNADEAAEVLSVSKDWLYSHGGKLGLRRKIGPKAVRYSYKAIQKFIATRAC